MAPKSSRLPNHMRFFQILRKVRSLVQEHGPYTTYKGISVFARATLLKENVLELSIEDLALSFTAAQRASGSAQLDGPEKEELTFFVQLWDIAIMLLEDILQRGTLDQESLWWGVYGLASGYMEAPTRNNAMHNSVASYKSRLRAALLSLPSIDKPRATEYTINQRTRVEGLVKARREMHLCTVLLLQRFRQEQWRRIRWWHTIAVVERWLGRLGFVDEDKKQSDQECIKKDFQFP